MYINVLETDH